ncbi:uncharacterized protein LOC111327235 [Stylophora pistillata]|uniref:uncharacterized protein LOC111327235 n=1 Tax=Stylophora pistillata TaxID=50429 RepID=UPI000C055375|nr:uncharacterized protein LOC111327235 [Stylophora pistillata]
MTPRTFKHLLCLLAFTQWSYLVEGSHFRHAFMSFAPTGADTNTIRFTFRLAFRRSLSYSYYCDDDTTNRGGIIGSGDSWRAKCSDHLSAVCSQTYNLADTGFRCTDFSSDEDWSMGENNFTYTFPSSNVEWTVSYHSCCWISNLARYASSDWLVSTKIGLSKRSDNGKINSSPVSRSPAIVRFQEGCQKSLIIPVEDPDGDFVKCRWATDAESSIPNDSFSYGELDEKNCVLTYRGGRGALGTYAVTLTLEDFPAGTTNFNNIRPFSAVPLQFLVIISAGSGSCQDIPVFTASTPQKGECLEIQIGSAYVAVIEVRLPNIAKHVVEITTSSPLGMQLTPLRFHGGIYSRNVTWYPNQNQVGQQLFCFQALDSDGLQSEWRCVTILVGLSNTPHVILGTRRPISPMSEIGTGLIWWSIQFDRVIKKPRSTAFIRLVLQSNGFTVFKVDALSGYVIIDSNRTALHFATPKAALSMNGSYAILIDHGAVVGQGCSYDGPPTPGITSPKDWAFPVDGTCPVGYALAPPSFQKCKDIDECGGHYRSKRSYWWWQYSETSANHLPSSIPADISPTPASVTPLSTVSLPAASASCHYNLYGPHGNFSSPNYPQNYDHYLQCAWNITTSPGLYIYLHFDHFHLEGSSGSCPYDYVQIYDGTSHQSLTMKRCDYQDSWCVYSHSNALYVHFKTDGSVSRSGFTAFYETVSERYSVCKINSTNHFPSSIAADISPNPASVTPMSSASLPVASASCHYNLYGPHGHFSSPNYPQNYGHNLQCAWHITTLPGFYIYLRFDHFHLEGSSGSCPYDYVQIYDGTSHQSLTMKRCDYQDSWCVYSHSNALYVHFKTDVSVSRSGFTAVYETVSERYSVCKVNSKLLTYRIFDRVSLLFSASITPMPTASLPAASASCHYRLYGPHGNFSSPNYPQKYDHYLQCAWHITTSPGLYIYLRFDHFHLEGSSGSCPYDYVQIYDGTSHQILTMKRCDYQDSWCIYSHSNGLYVHFKTDHSVSHTGFTAVYETVSERYSVCKVNSTLNSTNIAPTPSQHLAVTTSAIPGNCFHHLNQPSGSFESPGKPGCYPNNKDCTWLLEAPIGKYVYLQFNSFHLEYGGSHCPWDYVTILDGNSLHSPVVVKACGQLARLRLFSGGRFLMVLFHSDGIINRPGFHAYFQASHYRYNITLPSQQVPMTSQVQCLPIQTQTATPTSSNLQGIHPTPASTMATTFYAASSVNVQPDPSQFQFRLPAECDQSCHNTFGSYTCSCVRGYQLAADRKSCLDVDECSINNGGCSHHCYNIPGSFYCGCPEGTSMGANNLTCVEPGVSVNCSDIMTVALEKKTFPFFDAARLHLRYSSCRATQNNTHLLLRTPLNGCGTLVNETEDDLFFWNEIQTDVIVIDNVITRSHDIKIPFYCGYSRKKWVNLGINPQHLRFGTEAGYGNFTFKIDFYKSSSFATPYTEQDYPLSVPINQYLYVRYSVESSADLVIMAVTCKATKTGSFYSWPQYSIIQNGCPQDTSMEYNFDPRRNYQQFKIRAFRFFNDYDQVYIHCEVLACHTYSPNSRCSQSCLGSKKRKRRDVTRDEIEHEESTTKVTLTRGPLIIQLEQEQGDTDQNKQTALIGGLAGAGGFALIAVAALAVLFVKYRIARRFMNRNKVGDQYATQDGQLSRRNAYVQPEDMVEHEDAF